MSGPTTNVNNTPVTNIILPNSSGASGATHDSQYGLGGWSEISIAANLSAGFTLGTSDAVDNTSYFKLRQGKIFYAQDTQGLSLTQSVTQNGALGNYTATFQPCQLTYQFTSLTSLIAAMSATPPLPIGIHQVISPGSNGYSLTINYNGTSATLAALEGTGTFNSQGALTAAGTNVPNGNYRVGATVQNVNSGTITQLGSGNNSGISNVSIAGSTGLVAPNITAGGPLTLTGTLVPAAGGTGVTSLEALATAIGSAFATAAQGTLASNNAAVNGIVVSNGSGTFSAATSTSITSLIATNTYESYGKISGVTLTSLANGLIKLTSGQPSIAVPGTDYPSPANRVVLPPSSITSGATQTIAITGGTLLFNNTSGVTNRYIFANTATVAAQTLVLPAAPVDGATIELAFVGGISTLTVQNGTLLGIPSGGGVTSGQGGKWEYTTAASATFTTGTISGNVLTVSGVSGIIYPGMIVTGTGVSAGTTINAYLSGSTTGVGGNGTYQLSASGGTAATSAAGVWVNLSA